MKKVYAANFTPPQKKTKQNKRCTSTMKPVIIAENK